jgi:oxaloacetate decarboxylase alpha subunit
MAEIELVEQTFRDGQQSLWGMRLRAGMVEAVAQDLDQAGFRAVEVTGSSLFECSVRYSLEDPWEGLDLWRKWMPRSELRAPVCQNRIGTFGMTPDSLMDLWVQALIKHGINAFWVYDCLYNMDQMHRLCKTIADAGGVALGAIMYGVSPVHTDEWWSARVAEMASWPEVSGIYFEDAPGILTPERAVTLMPALLAAAGDKPVEWHCHNNTGIGAVNYVKAVEAGGTILHTCTLPLANGPSLPSTEQTLENLRWLGYEHSIDESRLPPIAQHCERVAKQEGFLIGVPNEYNVFAYHHQLPGGMTGTLKAQLAQYGMEERLVEVLQECVRVREELGHPVSATPFSQLIGIQSVLNIVSGERWSVVPDEVIIYLMGKFGTPPAPVDENVRDKVLSSAHGQRFAGWERPQPSLSELREQYGGKRTSDEELLLRYMVPLEDLEAAYAAGPVKPTYDFRDPTTVHELLDHALSLKRARHVRIDRPELDLTLRRTSTSVS